MIRNSSFESDQFMHFMHAMYIPVDMTDHEETFVGFNELAGDLPIAGHNALWELGDDYEKEKEPEVRQGNADAVNIAGSLHDPDSSPFPEAIEYNNVSTFLPVKDGLKQHEWEYDDSDDEGEDYDEENEDEEEGDDDEAEDEGEGDEEEELIDDL